MPRIAQSLLRSLASLAALSGGLAVAQPIVQIVPASPRYLEPVYARVGPSGRHYICYAAVSMNGNVIDVNYQAAPPEVGNYACDVELGRFPTGSFRVEIKGPFVTASTQFSVAPPSPSGAPPGETPPVNYSGMWWDILESGWGISIAQGSSRIFAVWFAYDLSGKATWYTLEPGGWTQRDFVRGYSGPVYEYSGPYFGGGFDSASVSRIVAGTGTLWFSDLDNVVFDYTIEGVSKTKYLTRLPVD